MVKYFAVTKESLARLRALQLTWEPLQTSIDGWHEEVSGYPDRIKEPARHLRATLAYGIDIDGNFPYFEDDEQNLASLAPDDRTWKCRFFKSPTNLPLWASEGDGLTGYCIEFDQEKLQAAEGMSFEIYEVSYADRPPLWDRFLHLLLEQQEQCCREQICDFPEDERQAIQDHGEECLGDLDAMRQDMIATRPRHFQHEEEIRLVGSTRATTVEPPLLSYPAAAVKSVIIGERMPREKRRELQKALAVAGIAVPVYRAVRVRDAYAIDLIADDLAAAL
ncbi:hypothetical protein GCM10027034_20080 [Ramlibacter solisilvae]|uniref:DUF2971 domain-containing protein n=1 Tax=Ramlibacter tataouinensis TaxID=94132 RepID=UPI0011AEB13B|nr:DUF2971 domain-containing protein [Ramlibacter tataouinensis]